MKVSFYVLQQIIVVWDSNTPDIIAIPEQKTTRDHFVFTDDRTELATNTKVEYKGTKYQIDSIEILDPDKR